MNNFTDYSFATKFNIVFTAKTPILIRSGLEGDFTDSTLDKTPDGKKLHINGYVWASLLRRSLERIGDYQSLATEVGKYENPDQIGVSPFWFESSFVPLSAIDIRPGIKIDRQYGVTVQGALYHDEFAPVGQEIPMSFTYFHREEAESARICEALLAALNVIDQGIENIGGGWSYGYGRLNVESITYRTLNLRDQSDRAILWSTEQVKGNRNLEFERQKLQESKLVKKWIKYNVRAKITDGQLLAIHSNHLPSLSGIPPEIASLKHIPDAFVLRRYSLINNSPKSEIVIPGKAIRQTLFSVPIERKLRTLGKDICQNPSEYCTCKRCETERQKNKNLKRAENCECLRCKWFGSTEGGGIIAVTEALVKNPDTVILNRIQLCEHSMQNINLFSEEYLRSGEFEFEIIIDCSREDTEPKALLKEIDWLLHDIKENAPPGWYRIGANNTCTGQVSILEFTKEG